MDKKNLPKSYGDIHNVSGCCFYCSNDQIDAFFDNSAEVQYKDYGRISSKCRGEFYSDLTYVAHLNRCPQKKTNTWTFSNNNQQLPTLTVEELFKNMEKLPETQKYHILACSEIMNKNPKIYKLFSPGTYIVAIHDDTSNFEGTMAYLPLFDCTSISTTIKVSKETLLQSDININIIDKHGKITKSTILGSNSINDLEKKIKELFGDSSYKSFKLYEAKSLNYTLYRKLNEIEANIVLISKTEFRRCSNRTTVDDVVPFIDFTYDVKPNEKCELNGETLEDYAFQASPCKHKFSVGGFFTHIRNGNTKQFMAKNINEESKRSYPYLITCPVCLKKDVEDSQKGGITTDAAVVLPHFYHIKQNGQQIQTFRKLGQLNAT